MCAGRWKGRETQWGKGSPTSSRLSLGTVALRRFRTPILLPLSLAEGGDLAWPTSATCSEPPPEEKNFACVCVCLCLETKRCALIKTGRQLLFSTKNLSFFFLKGIEETLPKFVSKYKINHTGCWLNLLTFVMFFLQTFHGIVQCNYWITIMYSNTSSNRKQGKSWVNCGEHF